MHHLWKVVCDEGGVKHAFFISTYLFSGSADFKTELSQSDMFDPRLQSKIIKLVDVSYGGENGFNQVREERERGDGEGKKRERRLLREELTKTRGWRGLKTMGI